MAKNQAPVAPRAAKSKTPAQRAKTEANKLAADQRFRQLQAMQVNANKARKLGFTGATQEELAQKYVAYAAEQAAIETEANLRGKVNRILEAAGNDYRRRIEGFLAARINRNAAFVLEKINDFMSRPRNRDVKEHVDGILNVVVHLPEPVEAAA